MGTVLLGCSAVDDALGVGAAVEPEPRVLPLPGGEDVEAVVTTVGLQPTSDGGPQVLGGPRDRCGSYGPGFEVQAGGDPPRYDPQATELVAGWASVRVHVPTVAAVGRPAPATVALVPNDHGPAVSLDGEVVLTDDGGTFEATSVGIRFTCR